MMDAKLTRFRIKEYGPKIATRLIEGWPVKKIAAKLEISKSMLYFVVQEMRRLGSRCNDKTGFVSSFLPGESLSHWRIRRREHFVVELLKAGKTYSFIARKLCINSCIVHKHVRSIREAQDSNLKALGIVEGRNRVSPKVLDRREKIAELIRSGVTNRIKLSGALGVSVSIINADFDAMYGRRAREPVSDIPHLGPSETEADAFRKRFDDGHAAVMKDAKVREESLAEALGLVRAVLGDALGMIQSCRDEIDSALRVEEKRSA